MKNIFFSIFLFCSIQMYCQTSLQLTFTPTFKSELVELDSIKVENLSRGGDTTLKWPDVDFVPLSFAEMKSPASNFILSQNVPNPVVDYYGSTFEVNLLSCGILQLIVSDISGRKVAHFCKELSAGKSSFNFKPGKDKVYFITGIFNGLVESIKVLSALNNAAKNCKLEYLHTEVSGTVIKSLQNGGNFNYVKGDTISVTANYHQFSYTIIDAPDQDTNYAFKFSEILSGGNQKTWRLIRDISTGRNAYEIGANDGSGIIWWTLDYFNRPCQMNDEWIFTSNGEMLYRTLGDYFATEGIYIHYEWEFSKCRSTSSMIGIYGEDLSAWGDGDHDYFLTTDSIYVQGLGAFIGDSQVGTNGPVDFPQNEVRYELFKLSEGTTDTLIIQICYISYNPMATDDPVYQRFVLVHYDNPDDEPIIPLPPPVADYSVVKEGLIVSFTNESFENPESYFWDFGDGDTSTEINPIHSYQNAGIYYVSITASSPHGTHTNSRMIFVADTIITEEMLKGSPWKIWLGEFSIFGSPKLGDTRFCFNVPLEEMLPGGDWECIMNDEFIFNDNNSFEYKTNGDIYNDGYMGDTTGCVTDLQLMNSGYGAAFRSALHTFAFYPGDDRPYIILTNGSDSTAAFLGWYLPYYQGSNNDPSIPPNGGLPTNRYELLGYCKNGLKEFLFVGVNNYLDNNQGWCYILERNIDK